VKRRDLIKKIEEQGAIFIRHGGKHDLPDDEGLSAGSSTQRNQREPRAQYSEKASKVVNLDEVGKFLR
jgi:hypothetical protein